MSTLDNWEQLVAGEKPKARLCVDCANFKPHDMFPLSSICARTTESLIDGEPKEIGQTAYDQRYHEGPGYCGAGAMFWQPKTVTVINTGVGLSVPEPTIHAEDDDGA